MGLFGKKSAQEIPWNKLETIAQLNSIIEDSKQQPQLIFKHSTRCSISSMAVSRFTRSWDETLEKKITIHFLDLIQFRETSNEVSLKTGITHESPQIIVFKQGQATMSQSHNAIDLNEIIDHL